MDRTRISRNLDVTNNRIATISPEGFSKLVRLKNLYIGGNYLSNLHGNMWVGLQYLEFLSLPKNGIKEFPQHAIDHMPRLQNLHFSANKLKTISADIFNPKDYPNSNGRPAHLRLDLSTNPLQCNSSLCWLKQGVEAGMIDLHYPPECVNGGALLTNENLNCTGK